MPSDPNLSAKLTAMPVRNIFVIALTIIVSLTCYTTASRNRYANLFAEALQTIETQALQDVPRDELFASAMNGMTQRLDSHSRYISGDMFRIFNEDMNQEFGGVGMYVERDPKTNKLTVLAPIPDTPAFKAGIRSGDEIVSIDGNSTEGLEQPDAIDLIRGPRGAVVKVEVLRNEEELSFDLERDFIHELSVHGDFRNTDGTWNYRLKDYPRVGYIRLRQFGNKSTEEIQTALAEIDGKVDSLIFDLRNNSGGLLDSAIDICDMFLAPELAIVSTRGRGNKLLEEHFSSASQSFSADKPVVVLINRDSASASEIVSACLQDHDRAVVIGETSWGKGTVQHVIPIERGRSALKLTTSSYWRPSGKNIDRYDPDAQKSGVWGVQPNEGMEIELSEEMIFENRRRRSLLDLRGLVKPENLMQRDEDNLSETVDQPLERALQHLNKSANKAAA